MSVIIVLIAFSLLVAGGFLVAFLISGRNGQFDDTDTPAMRMLFDGTVKHKTPQTPEILATPVTTTSINNHSSNL